MRKRAIIGSILSIAIIICVLVGLFFYKGDNYKIYDGKNITFKELFSIINSAESNDGWIKLSENNINGVLSSIIKEGIDKGNISVKGVNLEIKDKNVICYFPSEYKNLKVLPSVSGEIMMKDEKIIYNIEKVNIGMIPIPKKFVLDKLKETFHDKLTIQNSELIFENKFGMLKIDGIKVENNNVYVYVKDTLERLERLNNEAKNKSELNIKSLEAKKEEVKNGIAETTEALKKIAYDTSSGEEKEKINEIIKEVESIKKSIDEASAEKKDDIKKVLDKVDEKLDNIVKDSDENKKKEIEKIKENVSKVKDNTNELEEIKNDKKEKEEEEPEVEENKEDLLFEELPKEEQEKLQLQGLRQMSGDLGVLQSALSESDEKQVIGIIQGTVNNLMSNLEYDFWGDVSTVMSMYDNFPAEKKEKFKNLVYSYVDMGNAFNVKGMFE